MALRGTLTHRKTRKLAGLLKCQVPAAMGYVEALWHVTAEQVPTGNIGQLSNEDIAMEMFYTDDADTLIDALISAGWLDHNREHRLIVHDWSIYADDATDLRVARSFGGFYADGNPARMKRLSKEERAKIESKNSTESHVSLKRATKSHKVALPDADADPVPFPGSDPVPDAVPVLQNHQTAPASKPPLMENTEAEEELGDWGKFDPGEKVRLAVRGIYKDWPIGCSCSKAEESAIRLMFSYPSAEAFISAIKMAAASHKAFWIAHSTAFRPHLHKWFDDGDFRRNDPPHAVRNKTSGKAAVMDYLMGKSA